nr:hypothetical protein [uncultured Bacteroides sp.]
MNINEYEVLIVSPMDREYLVVEISRGNHFFAEINQEHESLEIQVYNPISDLDKFPFEPFYDVLNRAKLHLLEGNVRTFNQMEISPKESYSFNIFKKECNSVITRIFYKDEMVAMISFENFHLELCFIYGLKKYLSFPFEPFYSILGMAREELLNNG